MVTLATTKTAEINRDSDTSKNNSCVEAQQSKEQQSETLFQELNFKLSNELHSALELETTIRTFFDRVVSMVPCSGLHYVFNEKNIHLHFGNQDLNRAAYTVSSEQDNLGQLTFFRKQPFAEAELAVFEMLIGILFYPLRNALKYREALENSYIDSLTGLHNRVSLSISSTREIKLAKRHEKALSLLVIDIDHFKDINDKHGHLSGDAVLGHIASVISQTLRETDQVFRFGGEEFVAMLSETSMKQAKLTAERIRHAIENTYVENGTQTICVTASVGVASLTREDDFETLFDRADAALYRAKSQGRNRIYCERADKEIKKIA